MTRIATWALGFVLVLILCPVRYHSASTGIDPSWAVALNLFHAQGIVFGRDVVYTYGPLAWAIAPMPFGDNLESGIAFQIVMWLAFAATVAFLIAKRRAAWPNLLLAVVLAPVGARMLREFGYAGPDFFLEFLVLFWIACGIEVAPAFFFLACSATVLLGFIKISTAIGALAAVLAAPVLLALIRHPHAVRFAAAAFLGVPAVFAVAFRVYAGDWASVGRYLQSAMELSAGNSSAMSLAGAPEPLYAAVLILTGFVGLAAAFWFTSHRTLAALTLATLGPLFLEYKHSFTRQDSHEAMLFTFVPLALTAVMWFWRDYRRWAVPAALAFILLPALRVTGLSAPVWPAMPWTTALKQSLLEESEAALAPDRLPPDLLARTAGRPTAIYPYETAYAAANPGLQHRPFPVFQAYVAYTAYLDRLNAEFLESDRRPDFIIFDFAAIDDRHPLLDCPATFLAMYRYYEFDSRHGPHLLLRRRAQPIPPAGRMATIPARFNLTGKLRDVLFRTAPMYLTLSGPNGHAMYARVPPAVLESPVPLSIVPLDLDDAADLFAGRPMRESFDTIAFNGSARESFQRPLPVTITTADQPAPASVDARPPGVPQTPLTIERLSLDRLNGQPVGDITSRETLPVPDTTGFLALQGWAVLSANESTLWLDAGGRMLRTRPSPNPAPAALFPPGTPVRSFEAVVPTRLLGAAPATLRIVEFPPAGAPARIASRTLTVQVQQPH